MNEEIESDPRCDLENFREIFVSADHHLEPDHHLGPDPPLEPDHHLEPEPSQVNYFLFNIWSRIRACNVKIFFLY